MSATKRVTLAYPYTTEEGVEHRADSTVSLPRAVANDLLHFGRAREPQPAKKAVTKAAKPRPKKSTTHPKKAAEANAEKENSDG